MKILHVCLSCFYIDDYSYQENMLPKYHKKAGNDVKVLASLFSFDKNGKPTYLPSPVKRVTEDGIEIERLAFKKPSAIFKILKSYKGTYKKVEEFAPDVIFIHGVQFTDVKAFVKYAKKHKGVKIYVDNHSDFSNSATNWISKNIQHKLLWKHYAKKIEPYVEKFYGVLPARVDFLIDMYHISKEKVELLVMGADDEQVERVSDPKVKTEVRQKFGFDEDDFVIVNGGKIDLFKKQTLLLMDAVNDLKDPKIRLLVFGSIVPELKEEVLKRCSDKVKYAGWASAEDSYDYFACGDVACFPGRHSVYWEQVAGQGIPLIVKKWDGTTHVDMGGNVVFLEKDDENEIAEAILKVKDNYSSFKESAVKASENFLYGKISKRSIEAEK